MPAWLQYWEGIRVGPAATDDAAPGTFPVGHGVDPDYFDVLS